MRKYYLDNIRWMTILLVVLYHVIYMYNGVVTEGVIGPFREKQVQDGLLYLVYPWFMLILFLVAGMCSRFYLENHTAGEFVRIRTRKLLVPSTVGILTAGWIQGYFSMAISGAFSTIPDTVPAVGLYLIMSLSGTGVLWFIQLLWLFSMLLALMRKFEKGKLYALTERAGIVTAILLTVPVYLAGQIFNMPVILVYRFGIYGFAFFLGYFVFAHEEVVERISRFRTPLLFCSFVLGALYLFRYYGDNYAAMPAAGSIPAVCFGWITVLAILGGMKAWGDKTGVLSGFMTKRSFGLYVFHYLPLSACAYLLDRYTGLSAPFCYMLSGCAALFGGLLLNEVVSRIPVLRWCVLGVKRQSNGRLL